MWLGFYDIHVADKCHSKARVFGRACSLVGLDVFVDTCRFAVVRPHELKIAYFLPSSLASNSIVEKSDLNTECSFQRSIVGGTTYSKHAPSMGWMDFSGVFTFTILDAPEFAADVLRHCGVPLDSHSSIQFR